VRIKGSAVVGAQKAQCFIVRICVMVGMKGSASEVVRGHKGQCKRLETTAEYSVFGLNPKP
jgi:hypothetical protein